jgi:hypothetical protein
MATATETGVLARVDIEVGKGADLNAPMLYLALTIDDDDAVVGQAQIVLPDKDRIRIQGLHGSYQLVAIGGPPHQEVLRVISLQGSFHYPPTSGAIQDFSAHLVLHEEDWNGNGSFKYGGNQVKDAPATGHVVG